MSKTIIPIRNAGSFLSRLVAASLVAGIGWFAAGCTRTVEVPRDNFDMVRDSGVEYLLVRTVSGRTWTVHECWATDSTLVVSMTKGPAAQGGQYPSKVSNPIFIRHRPPMEIPFDEICWIDRVERDEVVSNAAVLSVGVLAAFFMILVLAANSGPAYGY